ncbi:MAG TPA: M20/M25/M40 family metallo-hydrolase [Gemmatimonadaceae bacterium]|nr:M20/M25/M40 family metallo-hydrolase [Gemmatimonadaceae bacterium]
MNDQWLAELREFIAIPSVSADPAHQEDVARAAEWVRDFVKRAGGEAELVRHGTRDLVIGDIPANVNGAGAPTILIYGHFDVQPPAPLDLWESPPFELEERDGWFYARGIADDKGQLYTLLKAAELLRADGALPVNIRVACDGEEEIGGHSIVEFLEQDDRGADACIIFDGGMTRPEQPEFGLATRGLVGYHVTVRTGERDMHSGYYGGAALNAIHALIQGLSALLARDGLLPDQLRVGRTALTDVEIESLKKLPSGAEILEDAGAKPLDPNAARDFYDRTWAEPSLDVNGIFGGKPDFVNTTLIVEAHARFTIRLAPGQDPDTVGSAAEKLFRAAVPEGADVTMERENSAPPGVFSPDSRAIQLGLDAFERAVGVRPILVRVGGTLPIYPALAAKGIPTIGTGFALRESNVHSPNERLRVQDIDRAVAAATELYTGLAALG